MIIKFDEVTGIGKLGNSVPAASTPVEVPTSDAVEGDDVQSSALEGPPDDAS
jgi:hypothetical protein